MKKMILALSALSLLFSTGCLAENFWVLTWSEGVNRSIFAVVNAILGATVNNGIQL